MGWGDLAFSLAVCWNSWLLKLGEGGTWVVLARLERGECARGRPGMGSERSRRDGRDGPRGTWVKRNSTQVSAILMSEFTYKLKHLEGLSTGTPGREPNLAAPPFGGCFFRTLFSRGLLSPRPSVRRGVSAAAASILQPTSRSSQAPRLLSQGSALETAGSWLQVRLKPAAPGHLGVSASLVWPRATSSSFRLASKAVGGHFKLLQQPVLTFVFNVHNGWGLGKNNTSH